MSQIFAAYQAPRSPQQGAVDSAEVYEILKIVSQSDIRDYKALSAIPLKHYKFAYIFPEKTLPSPGIVFFSSVMIGLGFARNKRAI